MATGAQVWSQVSATNATIDTNINFAEGQAPSSLNDSCRSLMGSAARWIADNSGALVTAGTSTALTLATNQVEGSLTAGYTVTCLLNQTVDTNATLAVDGLTAAPIQGINGTNALYGQFKAGQIWKFTYSSTGTGQWIANGQVQSATTSTGFALLSSLTNTLGGNVTMTSTSYFDGPVVATLTTGVWFVSGTVMLNHPTAPAQFFAKLWDGTNITASGALSLPYINFGEPMALSGIITNPTTGNIKISTACSNATHTGIMSFNYTGSSADCTLTAIRIG